MTIRVKFTHYAGLSEGKDKYKSFIIDVIGSGGEKAYLLAERVSFEPTLLNARRTFVTCRTLVIEGGDNNSLIGFLQKSFSDGLKEEASTVEFVTDENKVVQQVPVRNFSANIAQMNGAR